MLHLIPQKIQDCLSEAVLRGCHNNQPVICCYSLSIVCFSSHDIPLRLHCSQPFFVPRSGDSPPLPHPFLPTLTPLYSPPEEDGRSVCSTQAASITPPFFSLPSCEHHLRPPVSHCSPAGSWEPFSTQMSANKDVCMCGSEGRATQEGGGGGGRWCVW